jgi:hypothetical protein
MIAAVNNKAFNLRSKIMSYMSNEDSKTVKALMLTFVGFISLTVGLIVLANVLT